jgi:hypothetical protein
MRQHLPHVNRNRDRLPDVAFAREELPLANDDPAAAII